MYENGKSGASKLTKERVQVIKQLFWFSDITDGDIAALFNVSREQINSIRHNNRWAEVLTPQEEKLFEQAHYEYIIDDYKSKSNNYRDFGKVKEEVLIEQIKLQLIDHICKFE